MKSYQYCPIDRRVMFAWLAVGPFATAFAAWHVAARLAPFFDVGLAAPRLGALVTTAVLWSAHPLSFNGWPLWPERHNRGIGLYPEILVSVLAAAGALLAAAKLGAL
ncbi:MAG: hypothetical protein GY882_10205 [Actinomycetia bacterium]|nr:hypothetical protein [Actinomycetes bacterium]